MASLDGLRRALRDPRWVRTQEIVRRQNPLLALVAPQALPRLLAWTLGLAMLAAFVAWRSGVQGLPDAALWLWGLVSAPLGLALLAYWRVYQHATQFNAQRVDPKQVRLPADAQLPFAQTAPAQFRCVLHADHYSLNPLTETLLAGSRFDLDDLYTFQAGSLDVPKLRLLRIEQHAGQTVLHLGTARFRDIWKTHYCPDLVLSLQQIADEATPITLRSQFGAAMDRHFSAEAAAWPQSGQLRLMPVVPAPLGISGVLVVHIDGVPWVLLRGRARYEAQETGKTEWSFSGTLEAGAFLDQLEPPLAALLHHEYDDEVVRHAPAALRARLKDDVQWSLLGVILNRQLLHQPELFALAVLRGLSAEQGAALKRMESHPEPLAQRLGIRFLWLPAADLPAFLDGQEQEGRVRNLCAPGLKLLQGQRALWA